MLGELQGVPLKTAKGSASSHVQERRLPARLSPHPHPTARAHTQREHTTHSPGPRLRPSGSGLALASKRHNPHSEGQKGTPCMSEAACLA